MSLIEGYFDESSSDTKSGLFCIAGYFLTSDAARSLDAEWDAVLREHGLPYFHMVDCAHGAAPFHEKSKEERSLIARKLIELIKSHTAEGFAVVCDRAMYKRASEPESEDAYTYAARMAVGGIKQFVEQSYLRGDIACFFEAGHKSQGRAYSKMAEEVRSGLAASVTFHGKTQLRLLQAADILAWQVLKYVKDRREGARPPRKDFLSLMEHPHCFFHVGGPDDEINMSIEMWPLSRRAQWTTSLHAEAPNSPLPYFVEEGEGVPIVFIGRPLGWRLGGMRMPYVKFATLGDKKELYLAFDPPRLLETGLRLLSTAAEAAEKDGHSLPVFSSDVTAARSTNGNVLLTLNLPTGGQVTFEVPKDALDSITSSSALPEA